MYFRKFKIWFLALAAIIVLLGANLLVQKQLDSRIAADKLVDEASVKGLPPMVAFTTVALGGFRGLLADMLWLRAGSLQEQGKYFELVQLASWITKLQPKFTGAAAFLAWNMAYNISITYQSYEERWRWVNRGIELIRDEALNYNANDPVLYQQLGWIYQHKIGDVLDDAQRYYKFQIAKEMTKAYGGKPGPDWEALDKAPKSFIEFKQQHTDPKYWKALADAGFASFDSLTSRFRETGLLPEELTKVLKPADALELENFLRASWLREKYKIRPEIVLEINRKYGVFDWRMSESFALYWAYLGNMYSPKRFSIECDRMITQSLKVSFQAGRILFPTGEPSMDYILVPNLDLVDAVRENYLLASERNHHSPTFKSALDNFMTDAIVTLYSYGRYGKSREYFNIVRKERPGDRRYLNFEQFVVKEWTEDIKDGSTKQAHELISGLIFTSCMYIGYDDLPAAEAHLKLARMAYAVYEKNFKDIDRVKLPSFDVMKAEITKSIIANFPQLAPKLQALSAEDTARKQESAVPAAPARPQ